VHDGYGNILLFFSTHKHIEPDRRILTKYSDALEIISCLLGWLEEEGIPLRWQSATDYTTADTFELLDKLIRGRPCLSYGLVDIWYPVPPNEKKDIQLNPCNGTHTFGNRSDNKVSKEVLHLASARGITSELMAISDTSPIPQRPAGASTRIGKRHITSAPILIHAASSSILSTRVLCMR
jgi:hypothetical protein